MFTLILGSGFVVTAQDTPAHEAPQVTELHPSESGRALNESIQRGDLGEIAKILFAGTSADTMDEEGGRPLCWAVRVNRRDIVELLLAKGADVNKEEKQDSGTALAVAAALGHADMVKLLLARGAVVNHEDHGGHTPLIAAAMGAMIRDAPPFVMRAMWGEEITEKEELLLSGLGNEHKRVVELLLSAGADANLQAEDCGLTALAIAAMSGNVAVAQMLLAHGANPSLNDWYALKFAETFDSSEGIADSLDGEDSETAAALLSWVQLTASGRQQVVQLLRVARARDQSPESHRPTPNDSSAPPW